MKQLITGLKWICLFLSVPFISNSQLINDSTALELVFLEREIFESRDIADKNALLLQKSIIYKEHSSFLAAIESLNRVYPTLLSDSLQQTFFYELALNNYLIGNYTKSEYYLLRLNRIIGDATMPSAVKFLYVKVLHQLGKWDNAQEMMLTLNLSQTDRDNLISDYESLKTQKLKSPDKAETLSRVFPGVGQMYAGKVLRGLTSSTIQLGLLGFAAYSLLNGYYFSGTLTGVSLFYVFYMGGARHAGYLAEEYNKEIIAERLKPIEAILNTGIKKGMK
ncbi:MAG: hypothetical protein ACI9L9_001815 [Marivirga sp.]|jgi:hypothetical protein